MTTHSPSPMVRRRILAKELKDLRHSARMTHVDIAARLGWQQGKVSKIESARQAVPVEVVIALSEVCHATPEQRDRLVELASSARSKGWWEPYRELLPPEWATYVGLETDADHIGMFATETVPDLLQTRGYAAAAMGAQRLRGAEGSDPERRMEMLLERQRNLLEDRKVDLRVVLAESAVQRAVGDEDTQRAQRRRIVELADRPNVTVRVLPHSAGALPAELPFTMLGFRQDPHPSVVFIPNRVCGIFFEQQDEVEAFRDILRELEELSLSPEESRRVLEEVGWEVSEVGEETPSVDT